MAHLSSHLGLLLFIITAWLDFVVADGPAYLIKSKITSGNGCPNEHWVSVVAETNFTVPPTYTTLEIRYMDFTPEVSPEQPHQLSSMNCEVILELDQLPAGYQFSINRVVHFAHPHFEQWDKWRQHYLTDIHFGGGGPVAQVLPILSYLS